MPDHEEPVAPKVASAPTMKPKPSPTAAPSGKSMFPLVLLALFVVVIGASVYAERAAMPAPATAVPPAADPGKPAEAAKPAESAAPAPTTATVDDLRGLKTEVAALAQKLDAMPKPEPADLKPVHEKIDGLAKNVDAAAEAPKKLRDDLSGKLAETEKADAAMKADIDALKAEVASLKEAMKAKPAVAGEAPKPAAPAVDAAAMTAAVDLFKANKFPEALAAFKKLPADDARVLYFTALASGFATKNWEGETKAAVMKGIEREKAGSPAKADIDAAVGSLTKAQGKDWLDAYRAQAK